MPLLSRVIYAAYLVKESGYLIVRSFMLAFECVSPREKGVRVPTVL
jgi:hypothetical protein